MWEYFHAGGSLMWALLGCSVASLAVILERCWFWLRLGLKKDEARAEQILRNMPTTKSRANEKPEGIITAMLLAGLSTTKENCSQAMEVMALESLARMRRGMNILDTIITAAPMLGIMGTVLGIISSFDMLGATGVSEPKAVIAGIAQALITTASGLGIALFTIFPYNYFNFRIDNAQDLLEIYGSRLELTRAENEKE